MNERAQKVLTYLTEMEANDKLELNALNEATGHYRVYIGTYKIDVWASKCKFTLIGSGIYDESLPKLKGLINSLLPKEVTPIYKINRPLNLPIYKVDDTIGWYTYDEVHKRHLLVYNAMHGLSEKRIGSIEKLQVSNDNGVTWNNIQEQ